MERRRNLKTERQEEHKEWWKRKTKRHKDGIYETRKEKIRGGKEGRQEETIEWRKKNENKRWTKITIQGRKKRKKTKEMKGKRERKSSFRKSVWSLWNQNQPLNEKMFLTDLQTEKYQSVSWWPSHRVSSCSVSQNVIPDLWTAREHNSLDFETKYSRTFRSNLYKYLLSTQYFWTLSAKRPHFPTQSWSSSSILFYKCSNGTSLNSGFLPGGFLTRDKVSENSWNSFMYTLRLLKLKTRKMNVFKIIQNIYLPIFKTSLFMSKGQFRQFQQFRQFRH